MKIKSINHAFDFKFLCEARGALCGTCNMDGIWEEVLSAFEAFNADKITLERLQEIVRGYFLWQEEATVTANEYNRIVGLLKEESFKDFKGSKSLKEDLWQEYCNANNIID